MSENIDPDDDLQSRWESIIADAEIKEVPIVFLREISVIMLDGTCRSFNVRELLDLGMSIGDIEEHFQDFLELNDEDIDNIDFHINVEALAREVGKKTRGLLG